MKVSKLDTTARTAAVFATFAAFACSGCGAHSSSTSSTSGSRAPAPHSAASAAAIIAHSGKSMSTAFCGKRPITLGINDGIGTNGWSKASMAAVRSEAAKCTNVKQVVRVGLGSLQTNISILNSFVAEGADAIVTVPDFGKAELPAIRSATRAGVKVVAWAADPGGVSGRDYVAYVDYSQYASGRALANWMAKALNGKGNVVFLGGPAGNSVSATTLRGIHDALRNYPHIKLLTGYTSWPVTNWDAARQQIVMGSLLAKYPRIDGVLDDADGFSAVGVLRAYQATSTPMVPFATGEGNLLACTYSQLKAKNPHLELGTVSTRNWIGRVAVRRAIASAEGVPDSEPTKYILPLYEDTLGGRQPRCDRSLPLDAYLSTALTAEELRKFGKTS